MAGLPKEMIRQIGFFILNPDSLFREGVEMYFIRNKKHIFPLLFLVHYCAFVVSPLTCNNPVRESGEEVVARKQSAVPNLNLNIFFLELICQGLTKDGDIDENAATVKILVKRPRAILRNNVNVKAYSESPVLHKSGSLLFSYSSAGLVITG